VPLPLARRDPHLRAGGSTTLTSPSATGTVATEAVRLEWADVTRASAGDLDAFHRLYLQHLPRVVRLARWLLSRRDVDDVVQEAFVRIWQKLGTFERRASFGTWLERVALRVILRHRERAARVADNEEELPEDLPHPGPSAASLRLDLESAVATLPERARAVFVLYDVHGLSHLEVADHLGISPLTSRSQLHRARMLLRNHLTPEVP
jgi:RNA polymerase sigma-70 factor (ECF subfamily)